MAFSNQIRKFDVDINIYPTALRLSCYVLKIRTPLNIHASLYNHISQTPTTKHPRRASPEIRADSSVFAKAFSFHGLRVTVMISSQDRPVQPRPSEQTNCMAGKGAQSPKPCNHYVSVRERRSSNNSEKDNELSAVDLGPSMIIWKQLQKNLTSSEIRKYFSCQLSKKPGPVRKLSELRSAEGQNSSHVLLSDVASGDKDLAPLVFIPDILFDSGNTGGTTLDTSTEEVRFLHEAACDDDTFTTICLLFDREVDARFEMIAKPHLEWHFAEDVYVTALIKDIILYSHWKNFGVKDPTEHTERKARLLCLAEAFKDVRRVYGLSSYEEIRERYL